MKRIRFTQKQLEILSAIKNLTDDKIPATSANIMSELSYVCKRDALGHSMKILLDAGFIEKTGRVKVSLKNTSVTFGLTTEGAAYL